MVYRRIKPRGMLAEHAEENSSKVLPKYQVTVHVVYQPINHKPVVYCFYRINQKTRDFSMSLKEQ